MKTFLWATYVIASAFISLVAVHEMLRGQNEYLIAVTYGLTVTVLALTFSTILNWIGLNEGVSTLRTSQVRRVIDSWGNESYKRYHSRYRIRETRDSKWVLERKAWIFWRTNLHLPDLPNNTPLIYDTLADATTKFLHHKIKRFWITPRKGSSISDWDFTDWEGQQFF